MPPWRQGSAGTTSVRPAETCITCPNDCGECPACSAAPSCSQGVALPSQPQSVSFGELSDPVADADAGVPDGGFTPDTNCDDAQLRLRLSSLAVGHQGKEVWLPTGTLSGPAQAAAAAGSLANAGPYGWAFGVGSVALSTVAAAIAAAQQQGDWHMFDVTQTIDQSWMLPLSNGTTWSFTQSGGDAALQYPWSLTVSVEAWGCADVKPSANP